MTTIEEVKAANDRLKEMILEHQERLEEQDRNLQLQATELLLLEDENKQLKTKTTTGTSIPKVGTKIESIRALSNFDTLIDPSQASTRGVLTVVTPMYTAEARLKMSVTDSSKVRAFAIKNATKVLFKQCQTIGDLSNRDTIDGLADFEDDMGELRRQHESYAMQDVFCILHYDDDGDVIEPGQHPTTDPTYMFKLEWGDLTAEQVLRSCDHYAKCGTLVHNENLQWSYETVLNFCDAGLKSIIRAKLVHLKEHQKTGPIALYYLVKQMIVGDATTIHLVKNELQNYKIIDQEGGESIAAAAKFIRSAVKWLIRNDSLPSDINAIVMKILKSSSYTELNQFLVTMETTHQLMNPKKIGVTSKGIEYEDVIELALVQFNNIVQEEARSASQKTASTFAAAKWGNGNRSSSDVAWKTIPPKQGESQSKMVDGRVWKWCGKCGRYTWSHFTEGHKNPEEYEAEQKAKWGDKYKPPAERHHGGRNSTAKNTAANAVTTEASANAVTATAEGEGKKKKKRGGKKKKSEADEDAKVRFADGAQANLLTRTFNFCAGF